MKRITYVLIFFMLNMVVVNIWGQEVFIKGVNYNIHENEGVADCYGTDGSIEVLNIPETVTYNDKSYTVTKISRSSSNAYKGSSYPNVKIISIPNSVLEIANLALSESETLKKITIPNSVKLIDVFALSDCISLEDIVMPDSTDIRYYEGDLHSGPFLYCKSISKVRGNTIAYPKYIIESSLIPNDCPFVKQIPAIESSFSYFAYDKVKNKIAEWQKKKEYETTAQWKVRVTEKTRKQKIPQIIEEVKKEYIAERKPKKMQCTLGAYDADYNTYPVQAQGFNAFYAKVPLNEAPAFKERWNNVVLTPEYGLVNDQLGVLSCTFKLINKGGKSLVYNSPQKYEGDRSSDLAINLPPLEIDLSGSTGKTQEATPVVTDNDVDLNIPSTSTVNSKTFAVVIGNENYQRAAKVTYANNDAKVFAAYCQKALGLPASNVRLYKDATYGSILAAVKDIQSIADAYHGEINVIFYYAGHGIPAENTKEAYLLPVDADGTQPEACYPLSLLYKKLEGLKAKSTLVFMDACFSGAQRGEGMLASARGVVLKPKFDAPQGNMVVFSAAQGDETAYPYKQKGHGLFTYFLLKKLQDTKGAVTLGDLSNYVTSNVSQQSIVVNRKSQTPTVVPSANVGDGWKGMTLK